MFIPHLLYVTVLFSMLQIKSQLTLRLISHQTFHLCGVSLPYTEKYKHLGHNDKL